MSDDAVTTILTGATMVGRFLGQDSTAGCLFDACVDIDNGLPRIGARIRGTNEDISLPPGAVALVQLFEHPTVLWMARPIRYGAHALPGIVFDPVQILAGDGCRSQLPELAEVTTRQHEEGLLDAIHNLDL